MKPKSLYLFPGFNSSAYFKQSPASVKFYLVYKVSPFAFLRTNQQASSNLRKSLHVMIRDSAPARADPSPLLTRPGWVGGWIGVGGCFSPSVPK